MRVRAAGAPYGDPAVPEEPFSGAAALWDLSGAPDSDIPLILARYAALRAWVLHTGVCGEGVAEHALSAARAHLTALAGDGPDGPEGRLLDSALVAALEPVSDRAFGHALSLLESAARCADGRGHSHGARALREAAHRARWWLSGYPPASFS